MWSIRSGIVNSVSGMTETGIYTETLRSPLSPLVDFLHVFAYLLLRTDTDLWPDAGEKVTGQLWLWGRDVTLSYWKEVDKVHYLSD